MRFESGEMGNYLLLGDSGYPLRSYLLTPFETTHTNGQRLYNEAQIRTRNVVERTFGIWKRRFPILSMGIRTKLPLTQAIIVASAVLHNLAYENGDQLPADDLNAAEELDGNAEQDLDVAGQAMRQTLVNYFEGLI